MKTSQLKEKLGNYIFDACAKHLDLLIKDLEGQSIFAYAISGYSGFDSISVVACTREGLEEHCIKAKDIAKRPYSWFEVTGAEWSYMYRHSDVFESTNEYLDYLNENDLFMAEGEDFNEYIEAFYADVMIKVLNRLKSEGAFSGEGFETDILLGIQFADPDPDIINCLLKVSKQVNSKNWHKKILEHYGKGNKEPTQ